MMHTMLLYSEFVEFSSTLVSAVPRYVLFFPVKLIFRVELIGPSFLFFYYGMY